MATITITGIDEALARFEKLGAAAEDAFRAAAKAGGELMAEKISAAAPVRTGGLSKSIKASSPKHTVGDGFYTEVKPTGSDSHGESYAKIANIIEYGRKYASPQPFFYPTVDSASGEVNALMAGIVKKELIK